MPKFKIEQYELHAQGYEVEAANEAEAIKKVFDGEADALDNSLEYVEVAEDYGLPAENYPDLVTKLEQLGEHVDELISSIRSVEQVEE